jgi:Nif-specific regulatory protein
VPKTLPPDPSWLAQERLLLSLVMKLVGQSLAPDRVLREMLHLMSELLGLNRGRVVLADGVDMAHPRPPRRANGASSIRVSYGLTSAEAGRGRYASGEGITGAVLATGQPLIVQDVDAEPRFLFRAVPRSRLPPETVAFLALPIDVEGRTIGVLACHRIRSRHRQLDDDVAVLRILATLAGQLLRLRALVDEQTQALDAHNALLKGALAAESARYGIIGSAPALLRALGALERVSQATASVLLLGESGTGKELFARAVHLASPRRDAPFVKMNCAAIPESLFESELFGHERGAFTGAQVARAGWFEQADGGTLFLDEVGELPPSMQAKLLRTLQEGTVLRLGGRQERRVDVRVVAATHRDLQAEVERGQFRRDLFYRLNVIPIVLPCLRERREDIRALALHVLSRVTQANQRNVSLTPEAFAVLERHDWPGNVRELANVVERAVLLSERPSVSGDEMARLIGSGREEGSPTRTVAEIDAQSSHPEPAAPFGTPAAPAAAAGPMVVRNYLDRDSHSAQELRDAMQRAGGNQSRAAQALGLTVRQFSYRWRRLNPVRADETG